MSGRGPGRPRSDARALTRESIVTAAIGLLDSEGLEGLTMRALAAKLGVTPMSIHHHVGSRRQLLVAMADAIYAAPDMPITATDPRREIESLLTGYYESVLAHPNMTLAIFADPGLYGGAAKRLTDSVSARLGQLRLEGATGVRWRDILVDHLHGVAIAMALADPREDAFAPALDFYRDALGALLDAMPTTTG